MNKRITSLLISLALLAFVLVGVASCTPTTENECQHDWAAATCSAPKTCTICSETEGGALGHSWTEASCTEAKICSVCSATEGTALGHSWVEANCTEAKVCSVCSVTEGEALGHSWVGGSCTEGMHCANCSATEGAPIGHTWVEATCTEAKHCSVCSATEGTAPGHSWVEATCTEKKYCSVCSATEGTALGHTGGSASCSKRAECDRCGNEYGLLTDHLYDQQNPVSHYLVSDATCEAAAVYYISCACGAQGEETFIYGDPLGHDIVYQKAVDETGVGISTHIVVCLNDCGIFNAESCSGGTASCIEKAECQYCGAEYGEEPSHNWVEGATTSAGCENAGSIAYQCSVCFETKSETIAPLGHSYVVTVVAPTCNSVGYTNHDCSACDYSYNDSEVAALSHVWNIDPTCASGRYCTLGCGATEEALAHNYVKGNTVAPGCLTDGYTVATCQNGCGDSIHVDIVSATGHNIDGVEAVDVHVAGCEYKQTYVCNSCNLTVDGKTVYHHTHKASVVLDATCVSLGEWLYKCENCSDSYTKTIEKNDNHAWDNGVKSGNIITYTCTACSKTKTVVDASGSTSAGVSKDDLANAGEVKLENANINLGGITNGVLSDKDDITVSANTIDKNELISSGLSEEELAQVGNNPVYDFSLMSGNESIHDFGGGLVTVTLPYTLSEGEDVDSIAVWYIDDEGKLTSIKATYSNGYVTFETDHFSYYTVTRLTPAQRCEIYGHNDSVMTVGATCTEDGYTLTRCIRCARTIKTVTEKAYGHNLETLQVDATCTENGRISISCKNCSYSASQIIPAPGHDYVVISGQDPTCEKEGSITYKCNNCSDEYTAKLPPVSHDYQDTVVEAGCGTPGYTEHSCKNCTHSYKDNHQPAKEHEFDDEHCVWTFSDDNKKAHVVLSCKNNCGFTVEGDVDTTERMHDAECGGRIVREFIARYTYNGVTYSSSVTVEEGDIKDHNLKDKWTHNEHEHWIGCRGCGIKHELAPHEWIDTVVLTQPTCEKHGWLSMTCYCGRTVKEKIPATEDHYYVNGVCAGCGLEDTDACDHTELTEVTFNLADYGYCAGAFLYRSCECGEVKVVDHLEAISDITCSIVTDSQESDGNHMMATGHCTICGLKLKMVMDYIMEGCMISAVIEYGFYTKDGEEIIVFDIIQTQYDHGSTSERPVGVATSCGTVVYGEYCDACDTLIEVSDIDIQCPNIEEYMEQVNEYYRVYGYRCADCGLLLQAEEKVTVQGTCYYTWTMTIIFKIGDVEYMRIVETETDSQHEFEIKNLEMQGSSCSDGYSAEKVCVHCGYTIKFSSSYHETKSETINLADYGICEGTAVKNICMICNQVTGCYINYYNCSMNYEGNEGNLTVYRCSTCGTTRYSGGEEISGENSCQYIRRQVNRYYNASGELVLDLSYEYVYTSHNFNYTYELIGSGCEDGYIAYGVCNCGATNQYNGSGHHTEWKHVYFNKEFGLCYGYYYGDFCTNCDYVDINGYHDGDCSWNKVGEENGFEIHSCRNCGVVRHMKVDKTEIDENCNYQVNTEVYYYLSGECIIHFEIHNSYNEHEYEYSYEFNGERNCESGVTVYETCKNCDYSNESRYYYHVGIIHDRVYFADYDSCSGNGYIEYYSCPCGYSGGIDWNSCGHGSYQSNQYRDDEGRLVYVESYTCTDCQLRYTNSHYVVKGDNCMSTYYYTVMVSFGDTLAFSRDYTRTGTSHNIIRTVALKDGAKSCYDGVIVTEQCTDCDYSNSYTTNGHRTGLQERIDVSNHGSDCGGFVDIMVCACGDSWDISVENCLCDLDHYGTQVWIDDAMINQGQETADGYHSFYSYAYIYSCAVTDPEKCGFAIRYCTYWVVEGNCTAVEYLTVQIGYGDGSVKEYTYKIDSETYHNYIESSVDNGSKYECSDCGSYYLVLYHYGDNYYAYEYKYVNTLNDGRNKERSYYHEYTYYDFDGDGSRSSYTTKDYYYYVYADGSEYWSKYDHSYEAYSAPFGDNAYTRYTTYTTSDGYTENSIVIRTVYKNCDFILFERREDSNGSWYQYEYTYSFENGCTRYTVYTTSNGNGNSYTESYHHTTWDTLIAPTCTQPGLYAHYCVICEQVVGENSEIEPNDHNWYQITDDLYYCMTCRMQGIGGADGIMVIEDLTSKYGNDDKYVIGYWNRSNVEFEVYVSLIFINELGEEDQWILFDGIDINYSTDPYIGIWVSRAQVKAAAAAAGFTDESKYAVRISFVPVTASSEFDYAITFDDLADEDDMDQVVHDDAFLELFVPNGEYVEIKIEPDVTAKWAFYSMVASGDPCVQLLDENGNELYYNDDGYGNLNFLIEYTLEAGKTYYLKVRWLNQNAIGYIPVVFDKK